MIACSERRRGSRNDGKYEGPDRFFGINSSISPTLVSHARGRYELRCVVRRSGATSPSSAPISAEISASIKLARDQRDRLLDKILKPPIAHLRDDIGNRRHAMTIGHRGVSIHVDRGTDDDVGATVADPRGPRPTRRSLHHFYRVRPESEVDEEIVI
jgi:hypothetical protein